MGSAHRRAVLGLIVAGIVLLSVSITQPWWQLEGPEITTGLLGGSRTSYILSETSGPGGLATGLLVIAIVALAVSLIGQVRAWDTLSTGCIGLSVLLSVVARLVTQPTYSGQFTYGSSQHGAGGTFAVIGCAVCSVALVGAQQSMRSKRTINTV